VVLGSRMDGEDGIIPRQEKDKQRTDFYGSMLKLDVRIEVWK